MTLDLSEGHGGKVCVRLGAERAASPKTNRAIRMRSEKNPCMVVLETHDLRSDKPDLWDVMDGRDHLVVASLV